MNTIFEILKNKAIQKLSIIQNFKLLFNQCIDVKACKNICYKFHLAHKVCKCQLSYAVCRSKLTAGSLQLIYYL